MTKQVTCSACSGTGKNLQQCPSCRGAGKILSIVNYYPCRRCNQAGEFYAICWKCHGYGQLTVEGCC
ncbi:hypothetical protein BHE90_001864 [Fusarium euwallaceae]|uniref:CR-type domain-containing protein n=5 Tax=Fusarium solani species complex TaxID=232080 RepID=A0A3M2RNP9_9HYPO|nr:hypothetical protein CDV36_013446 [Fusarium kuroshium]RSL86816.1 hypothetical protein CEP51_002576 [Fusarium floridanum]RSM00052.1 hypothetical protein CEP52_009358 [Fusarium oligoseptatum]RSM18496.1 hypothetical protein CDV31_002632 [Fusarium ambrosium]RTE83652.1 hypothetical protein BHE90_001864 [Fusarium euwallaceae]